MTEDPLSDVVTMLPRMLAWHPWRVLRSRPDIEQVWELEPGLLGSWCAHTRKIRLRPDLTQAERRTVLTHELIHDELGHVGECDDRTELMVQKETARRCITIRDLTEALLFYGDDVHALASELWTDVETVETRLRHLHPAERGYLARRLAMRDGAA